MKRCHTRVMTPTRSRVLATRRKAHHGLPRPKKRPTKYATWLKNRRDKRDKEYNWDQWVRRHQR